MPTDTWPPNTAGIISPPPANATKFTRVGSTPTASAISQASIWSVPAGPPPAHEIDSGCSGKAPIRSVRDWNGDWTDTNTTSYSLTRRAIGVTSAKVSTDRLVMIPPISPAPSSIITPRLPRSALTNRVKPIRPPAPGIFSTAGTVIAGKPMTDANVRLLPRRLSGASGFVITSGATRSGE
jgi:hypothetical protein